MSLRDRLLERDVIPDSIIRFGIRKVLRQRLREADAGDAARQRARFERFVAELRRAPIAIRPDAANAQHYEVPAAFFALVLGPRMKYSCGLWVETAPPSTPASRAGDSALARSEDAMLALTCQRAELADGQRILELGCGWGSLTMYMAERFPRSTIVAVSNSLSQRGFIEERAKERGLDNVHVVTADMNDFDPLDTSTEGPAASRSGLFDRVVSVEMFEHMRNYARLLERVAAWLASDGKLFVHIFSHARFAYPYEVRDSSDWMAEHFFTGGTMPSDRLFYSFQDHMRIEEHWRVDGTHYERTSNAWLANLDANREAADRVLARVYGADEATRWRVRWRVFFMACAELFGYHGGQEWMVSHYRFVRGSADAGHADPRTAHAVIGQSGG